MFELESVSKLYGDRPALDAVSLTVEEGQTTVLIGPSGCGKSTLLRLLIGLIERSSGSIRFDGQELGPDNFVSIRRQVGYVVQGGGLFPHLTVERNVTLMARELKWPRKRREERLGELLSLVRLPESVLRRYPRELSGGQQQRVSLMRALMLEPKVLLLDEPLGALDPLVRADLQDQLADIFNQLRLTIIIVTHDMAEAAHFAGTIVLMQQGRIVQQGSVDALKETPATPFVTEFLSAQRTYRF